MLKIFVKLVTIADYVRIKHPKIWISLICVIRVMCSIELLFSLLIWGTIGCILLIDAFIGLLFAELFMDNVYIFAENIRKLKDEGSL